MQTLIVCEKPDAAARVARALDEDGEPRRTETQGVPVYESRNRHETILVCSAIGHLYAVDSKTRTSRRYYPVWDFDWKPKHLIDKKSARLARWIQVISSLANKADRFINACDYDVEGSLIGYSILSTGRVQGPTLKFVVDREEEIQSFTPTPFWTVDATVARDGQTYTLEYEKEKIPTITEAEQVVRDCKNCILEVESTESRNIQQSPPYPFDLSNLQSEAFRHFGYTPSRTVAIAEKLYLGALISYPRTSSQKLPPDIGYSEILRCIANMPQYRYLASKLTLNNSLRPNQGPKEDPAHPAVYPTGEPPKQVLIQPEANLLDLIIRRFMSSFAEPSLRESSKLTLKK